MSRSAESAVLVKLNAQTLSHQPMEELEQAAQGIFFVAAEAPPRVGTKVELDIDTGQSKPTRVTALIVWSRPARPGTVSGFRAQLQNPPQELQQALRSMVELAIAEAQRRSQRPRQSSTLPRTFDGAIEERVSSRDITSPMRLQSRPPPTRPPPPASSFADTGPHSRSPQFPAQTPRPDLALDLLVRETKHAPLPAPAPPEAITASMRPPVLRRDPIVVRFSSPRNYLLHFEQFLERGRIYFTGQESLADGALVAIVLEVPDGEPPLQLVATVERRVSPPEVPSAGWVAKFDDPDGNAAERLATASFIVSATNAR